VDTDRVALVIVAWLATYALHSTVLHGAAWLACALLARVERLQRSLGHLRERIWKLALLGGIATATIQVASGIGPWNLAAALEQSAPLSMVRANTAPPAGQSDAPVDVENTFPESAPPLPSLFGGADDRAAASLNRTVDPGTRAPRPISAPQRGAARRHAIDDDELASTFARTMTLPSTWIRIALGLWIGGVLFGLARWALDWRRLAAALAERTEILGGNVLRALDNVLRHAAIRPRVRLFAAPRIDAPITLGFFRPAICLPPCAEHALGSDELEALLAHETAHVLRRDPAWLCACRAIDVVLFFQPLNRVARARIADEAEYACDDWAVAHTRERIALASCLTEIAGWIVGGERELPAPGMAARGSRLELRVRRLLDGPDRASGAQSSRWTAPIACVAIAGVALFAPGVSARERSTPIDTTAIDADVDPSVIERALDDRAEVLGAPPAAARDAEGEAIRSTPADAAPTSAIAPKAAAPTPESFDADISELEATLDALRTEASHRATSVAFRSRLALLHQRLTALRKDHERLATLVHLSSLQAEAATAAPADVNSKLDDRK
jgi:beta-lactamase regulating signal transducer with metallopeptidase domain